MASRFNNSRLVGGATQLLAFWSRLSRMLDEDGDWSLAYARTNQLLAVPVPIFDGYLSDQYMQRIFDAFATPDEHLLITRADFFEPTYTIARACTEDFYCARDRYPGSDLLLVSSSFSWGIIETDEQYDLFLGPRSSFERFLPEGLSAVLGKLKTQVTDLAERSPSYSFYYRILDKYCQQE